MTHDARFGDAIGISEHDAALAGLTVFYDPLSYAAYDHPFEIYRLLRDRAPVYYSARRDLWVISRYADVRACLRDHDRMVNVLGNDMDGTHESFGPGNLVAQDPPYHTQLRDMVRRSFTGQEIIALEPAIRGTARRLIAPLLSGGSADFAQSVALPMVFETALRFVGAPIDDINFWQSHLMRSMARTVGQFGIDDDVAAANLEAEHHIAEMVATRAAQVPASGKTDCPDIISQILLARQKGAQISPAEEAGLAHLILSAATDAPAALLTNCIAALDRFPDLQQHLRDHPDRIENFVEEVLRHDGPAKNLCRQTTEQVTVAGVTIPADARVMVLMGSANRDERVFRDPDRFDPFRRFDADCKTLSFGDGIHSCMGAPIARMTARVLLEELLRRLEGTEIRMVGQQTRWAKQMVRGFSHQPVRIVTPQTADHKRPVLGRSAAADDVGQSAETAETMMTVAARQMVSDGVVALTLRPSDGSRPVSWKAGAHIDLMLADGLVRQYSLCGTPGDDTLRIGVLLEEAGRGGSRHVHEYLAQGTTVRVRGPRNHFHLVPSPRYLFIAGGIGITPILPMIQAADAEGAEWTLLYGGRSRATMAFTRELAAYGDRVWLFPQDETGPIDLAGHLSNVQDGVGIYCCGPERLLIAVENQCRHWPDGALHVERFAARSQPDPALDRAFEVHLQRSGLTVTVPAGTSIIQAVQQAGAKTLSSCCEGTCGTCETRVLEGIPDHRDSILDGHAQARNDRMMICVSRSKTKRLILDL